MSNNSQWDDLDVAQKIATFTGMLLLLILTSLHASLVFLFNAPDNALKSAVAPVLHRYSGPHLVQGWSLFAPNPPQENLHVLVRGRTARGRMTAWYDATQYFLAEMLRSHFTPTRALSEGLAHSAPLVQARSHVIQAIARIEVERTSALVLERYITGQPIVAIEIEVDSHATAAEEAPARSAQAVAVARIDWIPMPKIDHMFIR